jgi:hypothetical protein
MERSISLLRWIGKSVTCWWKIFGDRVWTAAWIRTVAWAEAVLTTV